MSQFLKLITIFLFLKSYGSPNIPSDPVSNIDLPDPTAVYYDGIYYAFGGPNRIYSNDNMNTWSEPELYLDIIPSWAKDGTLPGNQ